MVEILLDKFREHGFSAEFITRQNDLAVHVERHEAMLLLKNNHLAKVHQLGFSKNHFWRAEQVHGSDIGIAGVSETILAQDSLPLVPNVDGLITNQNNLLLGIYVADCGAIWLLDKKNGAYGLLHSGKKGTELNILGNAVKMMHENFHSNPQDIIAVLSPCIRPPEYEVDFAAIIAKQALTAGLGEFYDCGICTACDLKSYYSYRKELGKTGRMLALLGKKSLS